MKCISVLLPLVVCVCLWTGCSKTEGRRMLTDAEITAAIEGQWVKSHQITWIYRDGVEQNIYSSGYGGSVPLCKFTHSGECFQKNRNTMHWPAGKSFEVEDGWLYIAGVVQGLVYFYDDNMTMIWTMEEPESYGRSYRRNTYLQRVNEE